MWAPDPPLELCQALHDTIAAFERQGLECPTRLTIGDSAQRSLMARGLRPTTDGVWGTIMGIEIVGVSDYLLGLCAVARLRFRPKWADPYNPERDIQRAIEEAKTNTGLGPEENR